MSDREGIIEEIKFWDDWFLNKGGIYAEEYQRRLQKDLYFEDRLMKYINQISESELLILDAGSGPVTSLGKYIKGKNIEITAIDPLAEKYKELYLKHNYAPIVSTQKGSFLTLSTDFAENYFDFVYSRNSLDHSEDPVKAIQELVKVCKRERYVFFENAEAEATNENGEGLHTWDFKVTSNQDLLIQNYHSKEEFYLKDILANLAKCYEVTIKNSWITVSILK